MSKDVEKKTQVEKKDKPEKKKTQAEKKDNPEKKETAEGKVKKAKKEDKAEKKVKKAKKTVEDGEMAVDKGEKKAKQAALSLLAVGQAIDPTLSSLFAVKQPPVKAPPAAARERRNVTAPADADSEDEELSDEPALKPQVAREVIIHGGEDDASKPKRKRKRKDDEEQIEDAYMGRLARGEAKDEELLAKERAAKRLKANAAQEGSDGEDDAMADVTAGAEDDDEIKDGDEDLLSPPPKHETETTADDELTKANRTVFLGNVSTTAIKSKAARKTLMTHLASFFPPLDNSKDSVSPKVESLRFRSTPYSSSIPKKAAYAKQELMDATAKSTNAYAVYSTPALAREAAKRLNGTVVLSRHLRVDEVAHPARVDHRRCVFVGNLGFVDDETNIQQANEEEGREVRKRGKEPADVEEGLWRTFGKCGTVESVRVIRDSVTRVGKGIAYVQFVEENAVEAALLYDEKKFPPMLPRKLRVSRAKAVKRNAKPGSGRPGSRPQQANGSGYQRKATGEEASRMGRAGKLLGRAAAAQMRKPAGSGEGKSDGRPAGGSGDGGIRKPESFIFEGHRATAKQGKTGLKLGKPGKKKVAVTKRSASYRGKKK